MTLGESLHAIPSRVWRFIPELNSGPETRRNGPLEQLFDGHEGPPFLNSVHLIWRIIVTPCFWAFFLSLKAVASQRRSITLMACLPYSIPDDGFPMTVGPRFMAAEGSTAEAAILLSLPLWSRRVGSALCGLAQAVVISSSWPPMPRVGWMKMENGATGLK